MRMKILTLIMLIFGICNSLYANSDGQFGSQQIISTVDDMANTVLAADIDGDGDLDVISASFADNTISWRSNLDGKGFFGSRARITDSARGVIDISVADIDGDGDPDVVAATRVSRNINVVSWYENLHGEGGGNFANFGPAQTISTALEFAESVYAADIDGDGDMDVLSSSSGSNNHKVSWYENTNGAGNFGGQRNLLPSRNLNGAYSVQAGDMDGDTDLDVVYGTIDRIYWFRNNNGNGSFGSRVPISDPDQIGLKSIHLADLDNDGDLDVVFSNSFRGNRRELAWIKNNGGGNFVQQPAVDDFGVGGVKSVYSADLDNDGDMDILAASEDESTIAWYENTDGQGTFGVRRVISSSASAAQSVYAADVDGDGDADVFSASEGDDKIAWYRNTVITSCNTLMVSGQISSDNAVFEACEQLTTGPAFEMTSEAVVVLASGEGITLGPGFAIQQGGILQVKVCGQSLCETSSEPMEYGCHSCVTEICDIDTSCCTDSFDQACQNMVSSVCALACE